MTGEEAKKEIIDMANALQLIPNTPKGKAVSMALKALEQEPVLDKIRAEIEEKYGNYNICEWFEDYDYEENDISEYQYVGDVSDILAIIDKYKESEEV